MYLNEVAGESRLLAGPLPAQLVGIDLIFVSPGRILILQESVSSDEKHG
jgi:hypothetical protein